jgi:hypothetical protein
VQRQQRRVLLVGQQLAVGQRAGGDDAHHLALHRPLASADLADLLGHRHRLALPHQLGQVALHRHHRHAGHHHRLAAAGAAHRQRDVEQGVGAPCVVVEQLVEVTHAEEHQQVRVVGLDAQILLPSAAYGLRAGRRSRWGAKGVGGRGADYPDAACSP